MLGTYKLPLDESLKLSQIWLTYYREKANIDQQAHEKRTGESVVRDQEMGEKGKLIKHQAGDPMYRPKEDPDANQNSTER